MLLLLLLLIVFVTVVATVVVVVVALIIEGVLVFKKHFVIGANAEQDSRDTKSNDETKIMNDILMVCITECCLEIQEW